MAARRRGKGYMAWVRSHKRKHRRKRNPYPMAGTVAAINPHRRRHRKHSRGRKRNPSTFRQKAGSLARGFFGLPPVMPVVYGVAGFAGTAFLQGFVDGFIPAAWKTNSDGTPNLLTKYANIAGSVIAVSWIGKMVLGRGSAALLGIGGGIYAVKEAAHDFFPGVIPGLTAYTPLRAYTPAFHSGGMGAYGSTFSEAQGMPRLAARRTTGMPQLAAPAHGAINSPDFAGAGAMNIVSSRFRRFA